MVILEQLFVEKRVVEEKIDRMIENLTTIKDDNGEFLLDFDGLIVDDKSWGIWNWPQGVGLYGIYKNYQITKNPKALQVVEEWFEQRMLEGAPPKNVNTMAPLLAMAYLYEDTKDSRYLPYLEQWAEWVMHDMPRTDENGLQHATYGPENRNQLWDDTLMMTALPLAKIGMLLNRPAYIEEAKQQFMIHIKYLVDKKTGLWFHGWTFEERHNYAQALWARGNCWITIAIPEIIDILDLQEGDALRGFLINTLRELWPELKEQLIAHGAKSYQIFLDPETLALFGYLEIEDETRWQQLAATEINQKWWHYMAELMETNSDDSPVTQELREVFTL